jgi:hypothetical protein
VLEVNQIPGRHLKELVDLIGERRVERELNVHRTTIRRWLSGQIRIPGAQHLAIRGLLGDLPGTAGKWSGWRFHDGELYAPGGDRFSAGQVLSLIFLRQQLSAQAQEVEKLKQRLQVAEAAQPQAANDAPCGAQSRRA